MKIEEMTSRKEWERFISLYSPQSFFQSWDWGEVIKKFPIANCQFPILRRIGLFDNNNLVGIAQIEMVTAKKGKFLHIRHGPILSQWNNKYLAYLVTKMKEMAKESSSVFVRISPLINNSVENNQLAASLGFIDAPIHAMDGEYCWVLDLNRREDELLSAMRKTTRNLIKQAQRYKVKITKSIQENDLKSFLKLYEETSKRHKFVKHRGIIEEFQELKKNNSILLFQGFYNNKLISSALIIFYNHQAIYHHSASIEQKVPVNYLLQWEVILEAKKRKMDIYNFWGIAPMGKVNHPWKGLSMFKIGFGGRILEYIHAKDLPCSYKYCATYIIESFRKWRKGY